MNRMDIGRNRYAVAAFLALLCATLCGCLSVVRVPLPEREEYSDEGACTNRVWSVQMHDIMRGDCACLLANRLHETRRGSVQGEAQAVARHSTRARMDDRSSRRGGGHALHAVRHLPGTGRSLSEISAR